MKNKFMTRAIELSIESVNNGTGPFGAVIVKNEKIIAEGSNKVTSTNDPTAHGEIVAIREACKQLNNFSLSEINSNLYEKINLTRDNKLSSSDLSDGVISISNLGSFNIRSFDAIILPGQTYILAVGQIFEDVFVDKGKIEIGSFINLTLSCDHRAVDGVLASQFFSSIVQNLENISDDN